MAPPRPRARATLGGSDVALSDTGQCIDAPTAAPRDLCGRDAVRRVCFHEHQDEGCALTNLPRPARWYPRGDAATSATKGRAQPSSGSTDGGFFMSKEPKDIAQKRSQPVSTQRPRPAGVTFHGFVPDTDPRYSSGWNFLSGKNLRENSEPAPVSERERVVLASKDQEKPEQQASAPQPQKPFSRTKPWRVVSPRQESLACLPGTT
jgi:hypothetical protein